MASLFSWATNANYGAGPYAGNANKNSPPVGNIAEGFNPAAGLPASWLNWLFNKIGIVFDGIVGATTSLAGVVIDGTGGAVVTPVAGTAKMSANILAAGAPSPAYAPGTVYKDLVPVAGGYVANSGSPSVTWGFGISSLTHTGTGQVTIHLLSTLASTSKCFLVATPDGGSSAQWFSGSTTTTSVLVQTLNTSMVATDIGFAFVLYGTV